MSSKTKAKTIVKGYAKKLREDTTFRKRSGAEIIELAVVVAKRKHPEESFELTDSYLPKEHGYWTLERCQEDAKRFQTRGAWQMSSRSAYSIALRNGWRDLCCSHMTSKHKPSGYWTLERCQEDAKRFQTRSEWQGGSLAGYGAASKYGWLDLCCAHMIYAQRPHGYWTLERCQEDAKRFLTRTAWIAGSLAGYSAAHKNGWLDLCCAHMVYAQRPNGYWTLERCQEDAKRFLTRTAWVVGSQVGYATASSKGWLDLCCAHMIRARRPNGYWTLARCQEDAKPFQTRGAWQKGSLAGYNAAYKNGWLDLCCTHMTSKQTKKRSS